MDTTTRPNSVKLNSLVAQTRWTDVRDDAGAHLFAICLDASNLTHDDVERLTELLKTDGPAALTQLAAMVGLRTSVELEDGTYLDLAGGAEQVQAATEVVPPWVVIEALTACWNRVLTQDISPKKVTGNRSKRG
jgi:hypothetical protein